MRRAKSALTFSLIALAGVGHAAVGEPIPGNPLVAVPGGKFVFGRDDGPANEAPMATVETDSFAINRTEITNAQYRAFVAATGHRPAFFDTHPQLGMPDRPVVGVAGSDADAFCRHHGLELPSERQFERAARGTEGAPFPWGEAPADATRTNRGAATCCAGDAGDGYAMTAPVGRFPDGASGEGVMDLIGNVWEWTADSYGPHDAAPGAREQRFRVLRGGAWNSDDARLSATYRLAYAPDFRFAGNGGFRCVDNGSR